MERTFHMHYFSTSIVQPEHTFRIRASLDELDSEFFELALAEEEDGTLKITMMNNQSDPRYTAMGIPDAAIPEVARFMGQSVRSSSNFRDHKTSNKEYRTPDATKVWDRLVASGRARYDAKSDIYYFVSPKGETS